VVARLFTVNAQPALTKQSVVDHWSSGYRAWGESMQAAFASPEAQAVSTDVVNFLDLSRFQMLTVTEQEVPLAVEVTA